jgi:hypothetical protein
MNPLAIFCFLAAIGLAVVFQWIDVSSLLNNNNTDNSTTPSNDEGDPLINAACSEQLSQRLQNFAQYATDAPSFPYDATTHVRRARAASDLRQVFELLTNGTPIAAGKPVDANDDATPFDIAFNAVLRVAVRATDVCRTASVKSVKMLSSTERFVRHFSYIDRLRRHFVRPRLEMLRAHADVERDVVVVGAGPLGLASALDAYRRGANVRAVIEKRTNYTRNIWLDLYAKPWSRALDWWLHVGGDILNLETVRHDNTDTITVRALYLERAMALALDTLGISLLYGRIAVGLCRDDHGRAYVASVDDAKLTQTLPNEFAMCKSEPWAPLAAPLPFDIAIAADGASSDIRRIAGLATLRQEHFSIGGESLDMPHLHQTTTIVDFALIRGRHCPKLAEDVNGTVLDARYPAFVLKTVSTVFKRFYKNHCHLQIMWTREKGEQLMRDVRVNNGTVPWDDILDVVRVLFQQPPANVTALQAGVLNVNMFNVVIDAAPQNSLVWDPSPSHKPAIVTLVGDALVTAHYRLGIGINNGLSSLDEIGELIHSLSLSEPLTATKVASEVRVKQTATEKRVNRMLQFMLTVMFLETYCDDLLIYFDSSTDDMWSNVRVYKKTALNETNTAPNYYENGPLKIEEIKKQCGTSWTKKVIES